MRLLLLNQCFYPDVVATAQHLSDLARGLAARGHRVTVVASRRGYDNPALCFPARETWHGVDIRRIWTLNLGKQSKWRRAATFASFGLSCVGQLLRVPRADVVVALTSPPLISFLAALFVRVRGGKLVLWLMDLNPDEALAAGWLRPHSLTARLLTACQRYSFRRAHQIIALDRFMAERVIHAGAAARNVTIVPPWAHDDRVRYDRDGRLAFRAAHHLSDKYVVMYSGNHSPCHPLDTLLNAAQRLQNEPTIAFCFIGGGAEFSHVQAFAASHRLSNVVCLPYQPFERLSASLSAADLHVVVMGEAFTGIVHPCKIYNILATGVPFVYIGPTPSHVTDILGQLQSTERGSRSEEDSSSPESSILNPSGVILPPAIRHGDVDTLTALIKDATQQRVSAPATSSLAGRFSKTTLLPQLIELIEGSRIEDAGVKARVGRAPFDEPSAGRSPQPNSGSESVMPAVIKRASRRSGGC